MGKGPGGVAVLLADHRRIRDLLERLEDEGESAPEEVLHDLVQALSTHSALEIELLYPLVARRLEGGSDLAKQGRLDHEEVEMTVYRLQEVARSRQEFREELAKLVVDVRHHLGEEEALLFPALEQQATVEDLLDLGRQLEKRRGRMPTHPHPSAPKSKVGSRVAHRVSGVVDRLSDRLHHH
jgi:hemerythrin superfamily protein